MKGKYTIAALLSILPLYSCRNEAAESLTELEGTVFGRPDSVLNELASMDPGSLHMKSDKARYSLLYSQALDLNGIEIASDSIILPAVNYYSRRGDSRHRLRMCYYRARISENAGDEDEAMGWLKKGEEHIARAGSPDYAGRVYSHKAKLYYNLYDYRDALQNAQLAADNFRIAGDTLSYAYRLTDIARTYINLGDNDNAGATLSEVKKIWDKTDDGCRARYFAGLISISTKKGDSEALAGLTRECRKELESFYDHPALSLQISKAYMDCGLTDSVGSVLRRYDESVSDSRKDPGYYLRLSEYCEAKGDFRNALAAYRKYNSLCANSTVSALEADTKFIEERYEAQLQEARQKQKTTSALLSAFIILTAAVLLLRYISSALKTVQDELSEAELRYREIIDERNTLLSLQENSRRIDPESMELVNNRLALLDKVLMAHLSSDPSVSRDADRNIEKLLKDKENFIQSTAKVFSASHPKFCQNLKESGLNAFEAGYCCLYVMGLYAKDFEPYFSTNANHKLSNTIRTKLGLEKNGKKLKTYLCDLCDSLDGKSSYA